MNSSNFPVAWRTRLQINRSYQDYSRRRRKIDAMNRRRARNLSRIRSLEDHEINLVEISDSDSDDAGSYNKHYRRHCDFRNEYWKISSVRSKLGNTSMEMNDAAAFHQGRVSISSPCSPVKIQCISSDSELEKYPSNDDGGAEVNESESARKSSPFSINVSDQKAKSCYDVKAADQIDYGRVLDRISPITLSDDEQDSGHEDIEPKEDHSGGDDWKWKEMPLKKRYKCDDLPAVKDLVPSCYNDEQKQPDEQEFPGLSLNSNLEDMDAIAKDDKLLEEMNETKLERNGVESLRHEGEGEFLEYLSKSMM